MLVEVFFEKTYTGDFYQPKPGDIVIDCGANIGLFSLDVMRLEPSARVLAFEPFPENYSLLNRNLANAGFSMVETHNVALAGEKGHAVMEAVGKRSQDHRLNVSSEAEDLPHEQKTETLSFADVIDLSGNRRIALLKCDIEGSEKEFILNASKQHIELVDRFAIEWHDHIAPDTCQAISDCLGRTHHVTVTSDDPLGRYGMLYAAKPSTPR
ncbi:MAG: FkbM family methyltransferase [Planctomycetota bacterium]